MVKKILRIIVSLVGITIGAAFYIYIERIVPQYAPQSLPLKIGLASIISLSFGLIFYVLSPYIMKLGQKAANKIESEVSTMPTGEILTASIGLIMGLIIAYFISGLVINIPLVGTPIATLIYIFFGLTYDIKSIRYCLAIIISSSGETFDTLANFEIPLKFIRSPFIIKTSVLFLYLIKISTGR